jgi:signal-transduction protein with cAMP-binding, CBS, and nucleotidyltransferase domain/DNA polymerase III epsilon subunit-like protein
MPGKLRPANHAPLVALPAVVLDLETTGLNVARDRVIQIGAVALRGAQILDSPRLDQLIDPEMPIPETSSRIHGLRDADVAGKPRFADFAATLAEAISGCVVIGHNIAFDLAVLRHEAARTSVPWHEPPSLDLAMLVGALEPRVPDLGLETITGMLGVKIEKRHSALGDSMATAEAYTRLLPRLRESDVRTLGEALSLCARRADLALRQAEAGWHAMPGEAPGASLAQPLTRVDSYVYERRVDELMHAPPVTVAKGTTLREAARLMSERRIGALLVGAASGPPEGILTERDLLRTIADGRFDDDSATVAQAMSAPVETMQAHEMLYRALGRMDRKKIRHLCVVDARGSAVGMISQRDLLHHRASAADMLGDALATAHDAPSLAAGYGGVPAVAAGLVAEGLGGVEVARVVSNEIQGLTARAAEITAERMRAEGRGMPPAPWCLLVLGSGGRGESLLSADQDNALIHSGTDTDDAWFEEFGTGVAALLDEAGVPLCNGGVMAKNAAWRGTESVWRERVNGWLTRAGLDDLMNVDMFYDLAPVAGDATLARTLHAEAVAGATKAPTFLGLMAEWVGGLGPKIGMFGRLRTVDGRIDLKRGGLMPLVNIARTLALRVGSTANATPDRLRDAAAGGRLAESEATELIEMQANLLTLILHQQLVDLDNGVRPSSRVAVKRLSRKETKRLSGQLRRLEEILRFLRAAVAG